MAEADSGEKTEQATPKRMKEVREKGQLSRSEDLTAWVGVGAAGAMMPMTLSRGAQAGSEGLLGVDVIAQNPDPLLALTILDDGLAALGFIMGPLLGVVAGAVLLTAALQGGIHVKKFKGKYEQFNLISGVKRVFGTQALWNGVKALLKTAVVGLVLYIVIQGLMPVLTTAGGLPVAAVLEAAGGGVASLLQAAVAAGLALAVADIFVVQKRNRKRTRMTLKEVRDENKNTEGDPLIKSQRRSRQLAMSRNRMMAAVGDADVVLVNPTHVAVALKYEPGKSAPRVTAKGSGTIATRIREEAETKKVPMVRDIPLARALHASCELGQEIPPDLYNAVARILAFVMALKTRGSASGVHTMAPVQGLPVTSTPSHRKAAT
ncbi:EscU/YscU/HrcU family type III secretion system export apparatus switch protein [Arthrobacter jiangjiafuii]|uniref:EscU/YscU/HrcU family type III secretion system export apparatus switch protein n=1 Tax=Arthrobacter jiangjiafuii TaxID=2817475 RepID=A0A975M616_9MICC|nr:EscU/YscU/HrcU family type III secretion system export apparatus switch protein [Arthrobacter jiangjiafuii]MBP3045186.1 EscU/YscU/HrcU family type III secretion system export apparatus switch protein [Arthrobacter jiangjiafuii]QWC10500.1 EscU/YscU/HrcU family type III secretion system export apparatus switch protein [Arthrobacter jiangjiafuii]